MIVRLFMFFLTIVALSGCLEMPADRKHAANLALAKSLQLAQSKANALASFAAINQEIETITSKNGACYRLDCTALPLYERISKARMAWLVKSLDENPEQSLAWLYAERMEHPDEFTALRQQSIPKLLAYAEQTAGSSIKDRAVLELAGTITGEGRYVLRDGPRAAAFYAKAWAAGAASAANKAAQLFYHANDYRNAYMWSLRCVGECQRSSALDLDDLQHRLSPEAIKQAQQAAAGNAIELPGQGGQG